MKKLEKISWTPQKLFTFLNTKKPEHSKKRQKGYLILCKNDCTFYNASEPTRYVERFQLSTYPTRKVISEKGFRVIIRLILSPDKICFHFV